MTISIDGVEVEFCRSSDDWRKTAVRVKVQSQKRKQVKKTVEINTDDATTTGSLLQMIAVSASAAAEALQKQYGDQMDAGMCGTAAVKAFGEECRLYAEMNAGLAAVVTRLHLNRKKFSDWEIQALDKWKWIVDKGGKLSIPEIEMVQNMTARLHTHQL